MASLRVCCYSNRMGQRDGGGSESHAITIGVFDGVHLGHQELLRRTVLRASERTLRSAALTFSPHPRSVLQGPDSAPPALSTLADRLARIGAAGVADAVVLSFDRELASLSARDFLLRVQATTPFALLIVGENFRLGRGREAGIAELREIGRSDGWEVEPVPPVVLDSEPVSSSRIRRSLGVRGDVEAAARLLGRPFEIVGEVVAGAGRGRSIGVPTANIAVEAGLLVPANGVYYCSATTNHGDGEELRGVLNVGIRPTFDAGARSIELHILDWSGDLYGGRLRVKFLRRLREERKFESVQALLEQIRGDIDRARVLREG